MKPLSLQFDHSKQIPLYIQLYQYLRDEITKGAITSGEKLPSLRKLSKDLGISITTTELAYSQLLVEGYVESKPQSGYYVAQVAGGAPLAETVAKNEMEFAKSVADVVIYMADGVIEEMGTPEALFDHPRSEKTRAFLRGTQEKF